MYASCTTRRLGRVCISDIGDTFMDLAFSVALTEVLSIVVVFVRGRVSSLTPDALLRLLFALPGLL